jgi:toxin CcdB
MARYDIYENPGRNRIGIPFLVDVQSNVISGLSTRIVIPLRPIAGMGSAVLPADLFPTFDINGSLYFLDTPQLGAITSKELKVKIGSALARQPEIQTALDRVFGAY